MLVPGGIQLARMGLPRELNRPCHLCLLQACVQADSCGSDRQKKNCLFNLANNGHGPEGSHRCPPASQRKKAHAARTRLMFSKVPLQQPVRLAIS